MARGPSSARMNTAALTSLSESGIFPKSDESHIMGQAAKLREVTYERYEYLGQNTVHNGTLLTFIYDVPHFDACGIFPPYHIANQIFIRGTAGGGLSPGATWEPFAISEEEYAALVESVQQTHISEIKPHARYAFVPMKLDTSLDGIEERRDWFRAACQKHRAAWHEELEKAAAIS